MEQKSERLTDMLCNCHETELPKTRGEKATEALKILAIGTIGMVLAALASIGLISVYFTVALYS